jgi:KH/beta-lactamase-domain protein
LTFRSDIQEKILKILPQESNVTKVEFEGPSVVIYVANPKYVMDNSDFIKSLAKELKKHIIIRGDPKIRMPKQNVEKMIRNIVAEVGNEADSIYFDEQAGEVYIYLKRPTRDRKLEKTILAETGWKPWIIATAFEMSKGLPHDEIDIVNQLQIKMAKERQDFLKSLGYRIHRMPIYSYDNEYVRITCLGACQEVGRSAIYMETKESNIIMDMGAKPTTSTLDEAPALELVDIDKLDAVIISHAHLDHVGFLPYLFKYGYKGPVYMTEPTKYLMEVLLTDYVETAAERGNAPYAMQDIVTALYHTITIDYDEVTDVAPDIKLTLYDAGHEIGSAISHLHVGNGLYNVIYTGDFKYGPSRLLNPAHNKFKRAELLIMESTYGGKNDVQLPRQESEAQLIDILNNTIEKGGKALIPVFSTGRAQEVLLVLNEAISSGKLPKVPIYVDGMVLETLNIHMMFPDYLNRNIRDLIYDGVNPFLSEYVKPVERARMPEKRQEQVMDIVQGLPSIILAPHGMLNGGPALDYFVHMVDDPKNSLIFVSYQGEGTLGRRLKMGEKKVQVKYYNDELTLDVKMQVFDAPGFSGHSDRKQLMRYVGSMDPKPQKAIILHGEPSKMLNLMLSLELTYRLDSIVLGQLESVRVV